jgi:hypothetical protein
LIHLNIECSFDENKILLSCRNIHQYPLVLCCKTKCFNEEELNFRVFLYYEITKDEIKYPENFFFVNKYRQRISFYLE